MLLSVSGAVLALEGQPEGESSSASALPDSPGASLYGSGQATASAEPKGIVPNLLYVFPGRIEPKKLTVRDKLQMYKVTTFGPRALVIPALGAAIRLAGTRDNYPEDWQPSWTGYGHQFGHGLAMWGTRNTAYYTAAILLHEDPRYAPSVSNRFLIRSSHALAFAFVDRSDSGHPMPAAGNFAAAISTGLVGTTYLPPGYDDMTHAGQRAVIMMGLFGATNLLREFSPELGAMARKLHLPYGTAKGGFLPEWWVPEKK